MGGGGSSGWDNEQVRYEVKEKCRSEKGRGRRRERKARECRNKQGKRRAIV